LEQYSQVLLLVSNITISYSLFSLSDWTNLGFAFQAWREFAWLSPTSFCFGRKLAVQVVAINKL